MFRNRKRNTRRTRKRIDILEPEAWEFCCCYKLLETMWSLNLWLSEGNQGGVNSQTETDTRTLLYIKQRTKQDLLCRTGNSPQCSVVTQTGKESERVARGISWQSSGQESVFSLPKASVRSLVGGLIVYMTAYCGQKNKKRNGKKNVLRLKN